MTTTTIRKSKPSETADMIRYVRSMLDEVESMGGHQVIEGDDEWEKLTESFGERMLDNQYLYLFAETLENKSKIVGFLEACIVTIGGVFKEKKSLHIRSIFVSKGQRRKGLAKKLLERALEWGRKNNCVEADLNTLKTNPARSLYEDMGFEIFEYSMRRSL
jgi:GNAT superfamily N-acetyltransferase